MVFTAHGPRSLIYPALDGWMDEWWFTCVWSQLLWTHLPSQHGCSPFSPSSVDDNSLSSWLLTMNRSLWLCLQPTFPCRSTWYGTGTRSRISTHIGGIIWPEKGRGVWELQFSYLFLLHIFFFFPIIRAVCSWLQSTVRLVEVTQFYLLINSGSRRPHDLI